jgi:hypothetical protein
VRKIVKGNEPKALSQWKRHHPDGQYQDLSKVERQAIRNACLKEQYYLCAYCCQRIDDKNSHNEHIQAQLLTEEINQPQDGQLSAFAPILKNILHQLLNK